MATLFDMEPLKESGLRLNDAQRRAMTHGEGPLLVIAGAGTGKTRVITERIRHLLQSDETLSGENILGLTFTKKAAGEMKARVVKATGERGKAVTLATFHSFCETLLNQTDPERIMLDKKRVSFGSLITGAVALLERDTTLRESLQQRYRYILVDEFQDTNIAQLRLLELLAGPSRNIVAVGDNDQAIYRFRGASFASFQLFLERFTDWKTGEDSRNLRVSLTENYRSTPNILRVATQVIAQNAVSADFPKKLLNANRPEGEKIRIVELANEEEEAQWVADELQRIHGAGRRWRDFAVLYRQHAHRNELVKELSRRKIPFVIARLSILEHPLVRDVLAYLRLLAQPYDDIACARVLSAPAWHLQPEDLVRLAERAAKKRGTALYDVLQAPQSELPFDASPSALGGLLDFLAEQRKTQKQRTARDILGDLMEWLEIPQRAGEQDSDYVTRLSEFVKEWEAKSETRGLAEFLEYLDYFEQAGGTVSLEEDPPGDAVQLMTVHAAKGLEFPQVFVLRVNNKKFPATERPRVFEFPARLMKEGQPAEQFHIQEERRLFYVALTRAQERLTLTTLTDKEGKVSTFIEDIVMDPAVKRRDVRQMMPKLPPASEPAGAKNPSTATPSQLFPASPTPPKIFCRIAEWAESFHPRSPEPLTLSPSAVNGYRICPQRYLFGYLWSLKEGPRATLSFGSIMHGTIKRFVGELRKGNKLAFEELQRLFEMEWRSVGFEDEYQEAEYKKDGVQQLRAFYTAVMEATPPRVLEQEKGFELPLENSVTIIGRMDQVNSLARDDGSAVRKMKDVEIIDYKTGKPKKDADAKKDLQLSLYALAAKEIFEWNPVRLVFHYLQNNQIQVSTRDSKQLDEAQKIVQETAADIRAGEFPPNPGFICRSCAYKPICPAHEEALSP